MESFNDFINITVSVPRNGFYLNTPDVNGNTQVVPNNDFEIEEDQNVPIYDQFEQMENKTFYDDFYKCIHKTPDNVTKTHDTQKYTISTAGELKRLKELSSTNKNAKKRSPWRLIIQEEEFLTSSPILKKPQSAFDKNRDAEGFLTFLRMCGWKTGIFPG